MASEGPARLRLRSGGEYGLFLCGVDSIAKMNGTGGIPRIAIEGWGKTS